MKAVFLDQQTFQKDAQFTTISQQVDELVGYQTTSPNEVINKANDADIIITNKVIINDELMQKLPQLKLICIAATGMNNIDLIAAAKHNITVMNVSGYSTQSVGQYVFAQLLEYYTQISIKNQQVKTGCWPNSETFCLTSLPFTELAGKTLGILGYGNLGKKVANIAEAFDMNVLVSERPKATKTRPGRVSFSQMLSQSDIVTLHCPQTPENTHLFTDDTFDLMQNHAVLINTARGPIIDNQALLNALKNQKIAAAILDVLDQEPPTADHLLLVNQPDNLYITGHVAWASKESQQRLINLIANNIQRFKSL
jgi:glycerate dehydrogenase